MTPANWAGLIVSIIAIISAFTGVDKPMFVFGEEKAGLSDYVLDNSDYIVTVPAYGSVRSLNVGTTSGIVMGFYRNYIDNN